MPMASTTELRRPSARWVKATRVSEPPSPLLSARSRMNTYLTVTVSTSAQSRSDRMPITASRLIGAPCPPLAAATVSRMA